MGGSSRAETGQALSLTHFFTLSHYGLALSSLSKTNTKPCLPGLVEGGDLASLALSLPFDKHLVGLFIYVLSTYFYITLVQVLQLSSTNKFSLIILVYFIG